MANKNQEINLIKLKGLKVLNKETDVKKIYAQKSLCGVNSKYGGGTGTGTRG